MSATALDIEMPFAVDQKVVGDNSSVVTICITDITAKSRRGKEIELVSQEYPVLMGRKKRGDWQASDKV